MAITGNNEIRSNLLQCPRDNNDKIFFTLMDYLNNLFTSKNPNDILRFYDYFENRDQLIKWMRERPKGNYRIVEFNKDENDIIVVIPTMDVNGKFAKTCREEIFKGLHIIFVESGVGNYYFNIAHNINAGIKKALEYNPKWIILSADDMYKIDDVEVLKKELSKIDNYFVNQVFIKTSIYHSIPAKFGKPRLIRPIISAIYNRKKCKNIFDCLRITLIENKIEKKFKVKYYFAPLNSIAIKNGYTLISFTDFGIFSAEYIKKNQGVLFDDTFINSQEDHDAILKFFIDKNNYKIIDYKIGDYIGSSLGIGIDRDLRDIAGYIYLNYKWENKIPK